MSVDESRALDQAVNGLLKQDPLRSAALSLMGWQRPALWVALVSLAVGVVFWPQATAVTLVGICTAAYVFTLVDRVLIFRQGLAARAILVTDDQARAIPDDELPTYTILVPAFHEPEVVGELIAGMAAMEYPKDKLQVLLLLEADETLCRSRSGRDRDRAAGAAPARSSPSTTPRTGPTRCNCAAWWRCSAVPVTTSSACRPGWRSSTATRIG